MRLDILDDRRQATLWMLRDLGVFNHFYLAGGTALALTLGHRVSNDFDLFCGPIKNADLKANPAVARIEAIPKARLVLTTDQQRDIDLSGIKITLLSYPFSLQRPVINELGTIRASVLDITCMKAYALGTKAMARDYIDLAVILQRRLIDIDSLMQACATMFSLHGQPLFSRRLFLQQLAWTDDVVQADKDSALKLLRAPWSWQDITAMLQGVARDAMRRQLDQGSSS